MDGKEATPTARLIDFIETWWGESLGALDDKILRAPAYQARSFVDDMKDRFPAPLPVPPMRAGCLRPEVRTTMTDAACRSASPGFSVWSAPWLLLYTEEVITEDPINVFLQRFGYNDDPRGDPRGFLPFAVKMLSDVQALIEDGSLHLTSFPESNQFTQSVPEATRLSLYQNSPDLQLEERLFLQSYHGRANPRDFQIALTMMCHDVIESLKYSQDGGMTPLLHGRGELAVLDGLTNGHASAMADGRIRRTHSLAELTLPTSRAPINQIITLRSNEEVFATFRCAVASALADINGLETSGDEWIDHARQSMQGNLAAAHAQLTKEVSRKGALGDVLGRLQGLAFSTLGGGIGAVLAHGNPMASISGITIGATGQAIAEYAKKRPKQRAKKAAIEMLLSLGDPHSSAYS
jgi:hypothetical protein